MLVPAARAPANKDWHTSIGKTLPAAEVEGGWEQEAYEYIAKAPITFSRPLTANPVRIEILVEILQSRDLPTTSGSRRTQKRKRRENGELDGKPVDDDESSAAVTHFGQR
ncbi:unnamed protein product [Linum trigynum]|uniref:Uncharacterized protein n=1 Tax=Linum trigynum TaxID=586398 RepID=A0AAV2D2S0_9ROSI